MVSTITLRDVSPTQQTRPDAPSLVLAANTVDAPRTYTNLVYNFPTSLPAERHIQGRTIICQHDKNGKSNKKIQKIVTSVAVTSHNPCQSPKWIFVILLRYYSRVACHTETLLPHHPLIHRAMYWCKKLSFLRPYQSIGVLHCWCIPEDFNPPPPPRADVDT